MNNNAISDKIMKELVIMKIILDIKTKLLQEIESPRFTVRLHSNYK